MLTVKLIASRTGNGAGLNPSDIDYDELKIDNLYRVFAIGVHRNELRFFLDSQENARPCWYPAEIFTIVENSLDAGMYIGVDNLSDDWSLIIGYSEIVNKEKHFNGLLLRDPEDMALFQKIKSRNNEGLD